MSLLNKSTENVQNQFADYCRTGEGTDIKGVQKHRLKHYRRLIYNGINGTLRKAFPITIKIISEKEWKELVDSFIRYNKNSTPQIWKLPFEFYLFCRDNNFENKLNKPWLIDLLYFEWIEIEVHTMQDVALKSYHKIKPDSWQTAPLYVNPESKFISLSYPVHLFSAIESINQKGKYQLFVWRNIDTGEVNFADLGVVNRIILENLDGFDMTVSEIIELLAKDHHISLDNKAINNLDLFLESMYNKGAILGLIS